MAETAQTADQRKAANKLRRERRRWNTYQWDFHNGADCPKVSDMSPDQLRSALCDCLDLIDKLHGRALDVVNDIEEAGF